MKQEFDFNQENDGATKRVQAGGIEGTPGMVRRVYTVLDAPVCVYEAGEATNPVAVLLHGAMYDESRFSWDQLFPALRSDYHVFAVDTPRHGGSRPWSGTLDRARLIGILSELFQQLGLTRFAIVGLSMGGGLAIEYASAHPEQICAMALFEPGGLGEHVDWQFATWLYLHTPGMLRLLSRLYRNYDLAAVEKLLNSIYVKGTKPTDPERLSRILMDEIKGKYDCGEGDMDDWQIGCIGPFRLKWNLLKETALIRCPTLWLRGAESKLVKQNEIERAVLLARTNGAEAQLVVIPQAGHMLPLEQPQRANDAVLAFLARMVKENAL